VKRTPTGNGGNTKRDRRMSTEMVILHISQNDRYIVGEAYLQAKSKSKPSLMKRFLLSETLCRTMFIYEACNQHKSEGCETQNKRTVNSTNELNLDIVNRVRKHNAYNATATGHYKKTQH
jgi:hypothetical protein